MTSSQATSRPRIPRRGAAESAPPAQVDGPPRRRTHVRANAPHVVPFDTVREVGIPARSLASSGTPAVSPPVPSSAERTATPQARPAVRVVPSPPPPPALPAAGPPASWPLPDEESPEHAVRNPRRTALLVAVPVAVVVLGLAAVALGVSGRSDAPQGDGAGSGAASAPQDGGVAESPATGLDPELERRFALAVEAAAADGVTLTLTSGWRSAEDQAALVESAVERYGSLEEARRWVLPPGRSAHVAGRAIDVGPTDGALWLEQHGADLGLCRVYANELWHFEPVIEPGGACPALLDDSSSGWDGLG
ncbi:M15 family metallopeptidase [Sanguibacter sp. 4.1]|uniref:M15 family metallopeptidase n=1 Tax=Sanguibacter biliveldensis TaxID=3030830 RepID=A0AAF1BYT0_9MICO|nr:M15 family metallopeptidase [Sanguibacter sp. 4.1]WPF83131.1 M15 family metallopeptidase [Sanguibacter sp. 4.1]